MPNSALPGNTYLGDGQRTTAEMQAALNQVATWLNSAQAELNALTGTTFGEAAVRAVGTAIGNVPDTAVLNARLGTAGNLSSGAVSSIELIEERTTTINGSGGTNLQFFTFTTDQSSVYFHTVHCTTLDTVVYQTGERSDGTNTTHTDFGLISDGAIVRIQNYGATADFKIIIYRIKVA